MAGNAYKIPVSANTPTISTLLAQGFKLGDLLVTEGESIPKYIMGNKSDIFVLLYKDDTAFGDTALYALTFAEFSYVVYGRNHNNFNAVATANAYTTAFGDKVYYITDSNAMFTVDSSNLNVFNNYEEVEEYLTDFTPPDDDVPINYTTTGCTLSAPASAAPGQDVVITVNPAQGYTFRGSSGVDVRDNHGERIPFIINGNQVAFTMPQPY